jgi:hypothetical protein
MLKSLVWLAGQRNAQARKAMQSCALHGCGKWTKQIHSKILGLVRTASPSMAEVRAAEAGTAGGGLAPKTQSPNNLIKLCAIKSLVRVALLSQA